MLQHTMSRMEMVSQKQGIPRLTWLFLLPACRDAPNKKESTRKTRAFNKSDWPEPRRWLSAWVALQKKQTGALSSVTRTSPERLLLNWPPVSKQAEQLCCGSCCVDEVVANLLNSNSHYYFYVHVLKQHLCEVVKQLLPVDLAGIFYCKN